jgi:hypothetical protein
MKGMKLRLRKGTPLHRRWNKGPVAMKAQQ